MDSLNRNRLPGVLCMTASLLTATRSRRIERCPSCRSSGLEKWYGRRQVVNGVDYEVERGEVVGLLGPNGAGKTTSFRMTIGLIDADGGKVLFDGHDVTRLPMYLRAVPAWVISPRIRASSASCRSRTI